MADLTHLESYMKENLRLIPETGETRSRKDRLPGIDVQFFPPRCLVKVLRHDIRHLTADHYLRKTRGIIMQGNSQYHRVQQALLLLQQF